MPKYITLPDGSSFPMNEGETPQQAVLAAMERYPERFGFGPTEPQEQPQSGFVPAVKAGTQRLIGQGALVAGKAGLMDPQRAEQIRNERNERASQIFKPTEESFLEAPLTNTAELLGGSLPYMVAPLAAAGAATFAGAPGLVAAGLGGLASATQFTGSNLDRSMEENQTSLENTSGAKAVAAAVPQAALDVIGFRFLPGIGKLFGAAGQKITAETAEQIAKQSAKQIAAEYAKATGRAMTAEGLTEAMQQALERAQADISVTSPEAREEYLKSFFGGALLGGVLAPAGQFVDRSSAVKQSKEMAAQDRAAKEQAAAAEQQARTAQAAADEPLGPTRQIGNQMQIPGVDAVEQTAPETPLTPEQVQERGSELLQERRYLERLLADKDALYDREAKALAEGNFSAAQQAAKARQDMQARIKAIDNELQSIRFVDYSKRSTDVATKLAKVEAQLQEQSDPGKFDPARVDKLQKQREQLLAEAEDVGAQTSIQPDLFGTINVSEKSVQRNVDADTRALGERMGQERESLTQRRQQIEQELASLRAMSETARQPQDATSAATMRQKMLRQRELEAEIAAMERAAGGVGSAVEQPRLFPEPEQVARAARGTAGTARSEAQVLADMQIARAARDRSKLMTLVEELRDVRDAVRTRNRDAKADVSDASDIRSKELERAAGMQLPQDIAQRQALTDARYRSFGQMVSILDRFNRGRAKADDLRAAEQQVVDNLIRETEAIRGEPLSAAERQDAMREARNLLLDLKRRFGDTRSQVNLGTRKEPEMVDTQLPSGQFDPTLPARGEGPSGFGLPNLESRGYGDQTFGNRYAAAQSILEGLDDIRNLRAGTAQTAPGVDRMDSVLPAEQRLDAALRGARARATPEQVQLLEQIEANRDAVLRSTAQEEQVLPPARAGRTPQRIVDSAVEFGNRIAAGQDTADLQRELQDGLRLLAEAQQSETEPLQERRGRELTGDEREMLRGTALQGRKAIMTVEPSGATRSGVQQDLFSGPDERGRIFSDFAAFDAYLASDALAVLKLANGQTRDSVSRALKLVAPLQKAEAALNARASELFARRNELERVNAEKRGKAAADVAEAERRLMKAQEAVEYAVSDYTEALADAQQKLRAAHDQSAQISQQIADNVAALESTIQMDEAVVAQRKGAAEAVTQAKRDLRKATAELAKLRANLADTTRTLLARDGLNSDGLRNYGAIDTKIRETQAAAITAHSRLLAAVRRMGDARTLQRAPGDAFADFLTAGVELDAQRRAVLARIGGLTAARNRAQAQLEQAQQLAAQSPDLGGLVEQRRQEVALARNIESGVEAKANRRSAYAGTLAAQGETAAEAAAALRRQSEEAVRAARGEAPKAGVAETIGDREARDGARRAAEQKTLETRQEGPGTERTQISFEKRRQDRAALQEAGERMEALEEILAKVPMNEEQRAEFEAAAKEYDTRVKALEAKSEARAQALEGRLNAQRKRIQALQKAQDEYAAAEVDSPQRARAEQRVQRLMQEIRKQGETISKIQGIDRKRLLTAAERRAEAKARAIAMRANTDMDAFADIEESQTKRRTTSPATRVTLGAGTVRTGVPETAEARKTVQRSRITESQRPKERDVPLSKKEQKQANKVAAAADPEAVRAAKAAQTEKAAQKRKAAVEARKEAERLRDAPDMQPRSSRLQKAIDAIEDEDWDDALYRSSDTVYAQRGTTTLSAAAQEAVRDGRVLDVLGRLTAEGSTPFVRELASRLQPLMLRTKLRVADNLGFEGQYTPGNNTVTMDAQALTEEALLHELVHPATLRALDAAPATLTPDQQRARRDLERLFNDVRKKPAFADEYAAENVAEFASELMSNPDVRSKLDGTRSLLGRLYDAILRLIGMSPKTVSAQAVDNVYALFQPSRAYTRPQAQPTAVASVMRGIFPGTGDKFNDDMPASLQALLGKTVGRDPGRADKLLANLSGLALRTQFIDRFAPVEQLLRSGVEKGLIDSARAFQTSYFLRFGEQRNQFVEQATTNGVPQLRKTAEGDFVIETPEGDHPNLMKIAQTLSEANAGNEQATEKLFTQYLAVLRGEQVGFDKLNFDTPMTPAQAAEVKRYVAADPKRAAAFEKARKMYREYNNQLLDLLVQTDVMAPAEAQRLKRGDYVPYYREESDGVVNLIVAGEQPVRIGNIKDQPYLRELVGGNDRILPFFTGAMQNTSLLVDMALRNQQTKDVAMTLHKMQVARIGNGVGPKHRNVVHFKVDGEHKFAIIEDAVEEFGVPADLLVKGMEGIKTTLPAALRIMQGPANLLRKAVTRAPAYAVRQLIREPLNAWMVTGGDFTPVASSVKELAKILQNKSTGAQALERAGAVSSNVITGDTQDQARILRDIAQNKSVLHKVMSAADKFAMEGDTATRAVLYDRFRQQGMTHMQALLGSLEVMNFGRRGLSPSMQAMSMLVPFFNAQIQGLDVIYRSASGKAPFEKKLDVQRKMLRRGALVAAATLAYAAAMQDDEAYKNATPEQRALNWFLPLPGMDEPLRVPIPFELGYAFKALPELFWNVAFGDTEAKAAAKALGALAYQSVPVGLPQAVKPALEVVTNHSFFTGEDIESVGEQRLNPEERFRAGTTELSKAVGGALGVSPIKLDYLIRGYAGGLGLAITGLANFALRPLNSDDLAAEKPTKRASELPLLGPLFQPADGRAVIDEAYKDIEEWQRARSTFNAMVKQGRRADALQFAQQYSTQIALNQTGGAFRQQMGELADLRRAVMADTSATPDQKRQRLDEIRQVELALARRIREVSKKAS